MPRRRTKPAESHDRWLVSYADFVTLLLAFFVVMFASSEVDRKKVAQISSSYSAYLVGGSKPLGRPAAAADESARRAPLDPEMVPILRRARRTLARLIESKKLSLSLEARGLVLSLHEASLFAAGSDVFLPGASAVLARVARALREVPGHEIRLEGHTDNTPIRTGRFPSNWELSTARAIEVLNLLTGKFGLEAERVSVAGYGEQRPIAPNDSAEGRAANRRVDIVILSSQAMALGPGRGRIRADD